MGNHTAGRAVALSAEVALAHRKPGDTALALLDRACARYRAYDAEFESTDPDNPGRVHPEFAFSTDPHPKAALGMLMVEAFAPGGLSALPRYAAMLGTAEGQEDLEEAAYEVWREEVSVPFRDRYGFC